MKISNRLKILTLCTSLFFTGCATTQKKAIPNHIPPVLEQKVENLEPKYTINQRIDNLKTSNNLSEKERFLLDFVTPDSAKGKSLDYLVNTYLPENLFYIHYNGGKVNGKVPKGWGPSNKGTTFYIGNNLFLTSEHLVENFPDSMWTSKEMADLTPVWGRSSTSLTEEENINVEVKPSVLENTVTNKKYIFRVISKNKESDIAILEIPDSINLENSHLLYLNPKPFEEGDTLVHFMSSLYGSEWRFMQGVKNKEGKVSITNNKGKEIPWISYIPLQSIHSGKPWYLNIQGSTFPYSKEELDERYIFSEDVSDGRFKNISTLMSYNGNSGAPLFRKEGNNYSLAGIISAGRSSKPQDYFNLYGLNARRETTTFPKLEEFQKFIIEGIEDRNR